MVNPTRRISEDILLTNVLSFDIKVYDPGAPIFGSVHHEEGEEDEEEGEEHGELIGGYAGVSWAFSGGYHYSPQNFLFSLTNAFRHGIIAGKEDEAGAFLHHPSLGPIFGLGYDVDFGPSLDGGYCSVGRTYACRVGADGTHRNECDTNGCECSDDFCGCESAPPEVPIP